MASVNKNNGEGASERGLGSLEVEQETSGATVVRLVGEIDISNAEALGVELDHVIDGAGDRLVVDLGALEFMDSSGIALLLRTAARVTSLELRNPSEVVRRIIEYTGVADVLQIDS
jgi:stage II sporulation protein AA (anti-sigma F factor antagonist)